MSSSDREYRGKKKEKKEKEKEKEKGEKPKSWLGIQMMG